MIEKVKYYPTDKSQIRALVDFYILIDNKVMFFDRSGRCTSSGFSEKSIDYFIQQGELIEESKLFEHYFIFEEI